MEDSLVVEEGILVKFPSVPFPTCLLLRQLLLQGSFPQEEFKHPHCIFYHYVYFITGRAISNCLGMAVP